MNKHFRGLSVEELKALKEKAQKTNNDRNAVDASGSFLPPQDARLDSQMRTIVLAIECGLRTGDINPIAEGLDMLVQMECRFKYHFPVFALPGDKQALK